MKTTPLSSVRAASAAIRAPVQRLRVLGIDPAVGEQRGQIVDGLPCGIEMDVDAALDRVHREDARDRSGTRSSACRASSHSSSSAVVVDASTRLPMVSASTSVSRRRRRMKGKAGTARMASREGGADRVA